MEGRTPPERNHLKVNVPFEDGIKNARYVNIFFQSNNNNYLNEVCTVFNVTKVTTLIKASSV